MTTVTQFEDEIQNLLEVTARQAGRASGFIQRKRKLDGASFIRTLAWGWLVNPEATLNELSQTAALCGVHISPQGLAQRMTPAAAECLRQVLEASMVLVASGSQGSASFLEQFNGVYLADCSDVPVPLAYAALWPGGGNQHGARAAFKLQTQWDYHGGGLHFSLHPARQHEVALPLPALPGGALRITDSGYFDARSLQTLDEQGGYYLCRLPCKVRVVDEDGRRWTLPQFLRRAARPDFDGEVQLSAHGLRCRLLAQRVPETVLAQRQERLRREAQRRNRPVSKDALALAQWTVVVTNVPDRRLSFEQAWVLLRLRWQIELLFKLFKQHTRLEHARSQNPHRVLCEIYAKLLGLVIQHAVLLATCWDVPNQSLVKLAQTVRKFAFVLAFALRLDSAVFHEALSVLRDVLRSGCRLDTRKTHPSHFQLLSSVS